MQVFWSHGYEGATLADLQETMGGIGAPSFYAAFGSKEDLFHEAVELYSKTLGAPMMTALAEGQSARASIEALLRAAVEAFCKPGAPRGCLFVLAAMNGTGVNQRVRDYLRGLRAAGRKPSGSGCSEARKRASWHPASIPLAWLPSLPR
jgi:AcrR family transcriptional regulator